MTERSARTFAQITCMLALASILAATLVALRWRHERETFLLRLEGACERRGP